MGVEDRHRSLVNLRLNSAALWCGAGREQRRWLAAAPPSRRGGGPEVEHEFEEHEYEEDYDDSLEEDEDLPDKAKQRWSRQIRRSPGGKEAAAQWREAARIGRDAAKASSSPNVEFASLPPGGDRLLSFGKYRELTYAE